MKRTATEREALSRDRILRAALSIVDREGLAALSMRRVGDELGVEAMSLYNHVESKSAMLDGVFELVLSEVPRPAPVTSWVQDLRERARALRRALRAHPNALPLFSTRPAVTRLSLAHVESALGVLRRAGLPPQDALGAFQALAAFVIGHTILSTPPTGPGTDAPHPRYDQLREDEYPRVREAARLLPRRGVEQDFELGLDALLTGLAARPARTGRRAR